VHSLARHIQTHQSDCYNNTGWVHQHREKNSPASKQERKADGFLLGEWPNIQTGYFEYR
jgi:hypothetical protein